MEKNKGALMEKIPNLSEMPTKDNKKISESDWKKIIRRILVISPLALPGCGTLSHQMEGDNAQDIPSVTERATFQGMESKESDEKIDPYAYISKEEVQRDFPALYAMVEASKNGIPAEKEEVEGKTLFPPSYAKNADFKEKIRDISRKGMEEWLWAMALGKDAQWRPIVLTHGGAVQTSGFPKGFSPEKQRFRDFHLWHEHTALSSFAFGGMSFENIERIKEGYEKDSEAYGRLAQPPSPLDLENMAEVMKGEGYRFFVSSSAGFYEFSSVETPAKLVIKRISEEGGESFDKALNADFKKETDATKIRANTMMTMIMQGGSMSQEEIDGSSDEEIDSYARIALQHYEKQATTQEEKELIRDHLSNWQTFSKAQFRLSNGRIPLELGGDSKVLGYWKEYKDAARVLGYKIRFQGWK